MSKREDEDKLLSEHGMDGSRMSDDDRKAALDAINEGKDSYQPDPNPQLAPQPGKTKYYKSKIGGLGVTYAPAGAGDIAPHRVFFRPYRENDRGDHVVVGYLATDIPEAQARLAKSRHVTEITKKEYDAMTDASDKRVRRLAGRR